MKVVLAFALLVLTAAPSSALTEKVKVRAQNGDAAAQLELAEAHLTGRGAAQDPVKAVEWATRAATQGSLHAQVLLARLYREGSGVSKDPGGKRPLAGSGGAAR